MIWIGNLWIVADIIKRSWIHRLKSYLIQLIFRERCLIMNRIAWNSGKGIYLTSPCLGWSQKVEIRMWIEKILSCKILQVCETSARQYGVSINYRIHIREISISKTIKKNCTIFVIISRSIGWKIPLVISASIYEREIDITVRNVYQPIISGFWALNASQSGSRYLSLVTTFSVMAFSRFTTTSFSVHKT